MPEATFNFPTGFLWGTATSSYQNEGNNTNSNWSIWENTPGKIILDQKSGKACDWWSGKWKDDFNRAASTHQNAHRFSLEWSRIQPALDRWDESAIEHYRQMVQGLLERGITPIITLHHFSDPIWLAEMGGWENEKVIHLFREYVKKVVQSLSAFCSFWITINEPNVYAVEGFVEGAFPPGKTDLSCAYSVLRNMVIAHAVAYEEIHNCQPSAKVGVATNYRCFYPEKPWNPLDRFLANLLDKNFNQSFNNVLNSGKFNFGFRKETVPAARNTQDFIGLNYYTADMIQFNLLRYKDLFYEARIPPGTLLSENKFIANFPKGISRAIDWARRFGKPIYITENGIEDSNDSLRPAYMVEHLHQIWKATNYLIPIKGYIYWTLVDNFEWERGWTQKFGLWGLDISTQRRIHRPSVDLYAKICQSNSLSSENVMQFAPDSFSQIFPD